MAAEIVIAMRMLTGAIKRFCRLWLLRFQIPPAYCGRKTFDAFSEWNLRFQIPSPWCGQSQPASHHDVISWRWTPAKARGVTSRNCALRPVKVSHTAHVCCHIVQSNYTLSTQVVTASPLTGKYMYNVLIYQVTVRPCLHGSGQSFARTETCTVPPCVYTGPAELDEFLKGEVGKSGACLFEVPNLHTYPFKKSQGGTLQVFVRTQVNGPLAIQKFVQFRQSRVNARWKLATFCPCKKFGWTQVNRALANNQLVTERSTTGEYCLAPKHDILFHTGPTSYMYHHTTGFPMEYKAAVY